MIILQLLFAIGGIALLISILKYPKDVTKGVFIGLPKLLLGVIIDKALVSFHIINYPLAKAIQYFKKHRSLHKSINRDKWEKTNSYRALKKSSPTSYS